MMMSDRNILINEFMAETGATRAEAEHYVDGVVMPALLKIQRAACIEAGVLEKYHPTGRAN
jgi:hypothetical protein